MKTRKRAVFVSHKEEHEYGRQDEHRRLEPLRQYVGLGPFDHFEFGIGPALGHASTIAPFFGARK